MWSRTDSPTHNSDRRARKGVKRRNPPIISALPVSAITLLATAAALGALVSRLFSAGVNRGKQSVSKASGNPRDAPGFPFPDVLHTHATAARAAGRSMNNGTPLGGLTRDLSGLAKFTSRRGSKKRENTTTTRYYPGGSSAPASWCLRSWRR